MSGVKEKIDFELTGELAIQMREILSRGLASSKPEIIRRALLEYYHHIEAQDLQRARLQSLGY